MRSKRTVWMLLLILSAPPACTGSPVYYAEAIEATVVDAETQKPLEGVVVVAHWQLFHGTLAGRVPADQLMVLEAVTDKDGRFRFPSWGPKLALSGYLDDRDPALLLFKSDYEYRGLQNPTLSTPNRSPRRRSQWHGKTIELKPFKGTMEEYASHFQELNYDLRRVITGRPEECNWRKLPRVVRAVAKEKKRLTALGVNPHTLLTLDGDLLTNNEIYTAKGGPECSPPRQILEGLQL